MTNVHLHADAVHLVPEQPHSFVPRVFGALKIGTQLLSASGALLTFRMAEGHQSRTFAHGLNHDDVTTILAQILRDRCPIAKASSIQYTSVSAGNKMGSDKKLSSHVIWMPVPGQDPREAATIAWTWPHPAILGSSWRSSIYAVAGHVSHVLQNEASVAAKPSHEVALENESAQAKNTPLLAVVDHHAVLRYANERFLTYFTLEASDCIGRSIHDMRLPAASRNIMFAILEYFRLATSIEHQVAWPFTLNEQGHVGHVNAHAWPTGASCRCVTLLISEVPPR